MAVAFVNSFASVTASAVASQTVTMDTTGARCGVIFAVTYANAGVSVCTTATINGVAAPAVAGGEAADTATEPGNVKAYFLDNIGIGAAIDFVVNRTNNAVSTRIIGWALSALGACEVYLPGIVLLQGDGAYAEQSVDDGSPGTNSLRLASGYYGGASPPPVGANTTGHGSGWDETAFGAHNGRETVAGQGSRLVGFTQATADDRAAVHFAVRETPAATAKAFPFQARTHPRTSPQLRR